VATERQEQGT